MSLKAPFSPHKKLFYRHASADFAERLSGTEKRTSPRFFAGLHKRDGRPLGARLGTSQQNQLISISTFCMLKFYRKASSRWPLPLHGRFSLRWIGCGRSYVVTVDRYRAAFCPPPHQGQCPNQVRGVHTTASPVQALLVMHRAERCTGMRRGINPNLAFRIR
jgi:hypothetical protein